MSITLDRLNTPAKRVGALVALMGLLLIVFGFIHLDASVQTLRHALERGFFRNLRQIGEGRFATGGVLFSVGIWLTAIGLLLSYFHDRTIAPLRHWVRTGDTKGAIAAISAAPAGHGTPSWKDAAVYILTYGLTMVCGLISGVAFISDNAPVFLLLPLAFAFFMSVRVWMFARDESGFDFGAVFRNRLRIGSVCMIIGTALALFGFAK